MKECCNVFMRVLCWQATMRNLNDLPSLEPED